MRIKSGRALGLGVLYLSNVVDTWLLTVFTGLSGLFGKIPSVFYYVSLPLFFVFKLSEQFRFHATSIWYCQTRSVQVHSIGSG